MIRIGALCVARNITLKRFMATAKPLDPETETKLAAFVARTGIKLAHQTLLQAVTHTSFALKTTTAARYQLLGISIFM